MAVSLFIPSVWSGAILARLNDESAFLQVANRAYEGEVRNQGDKIKINELGPVTIRDYTRNSTSDLTWEFLEDAQQILEIDQAKYFAFAIDDLDRAQSEPDTMSEAIKNAVWGLRDNIDAALAATHSQAGVTYGSTGAAIDVSSTSLFRSLESIAARLDQYNVPRSGRWMVVPAWFEKKLVMSRITKDQGNPGMIQSATYAGTYFGFNVYVSNNIVNGTLSSTPAASNSKILFGGPEALALVIQVNKIEAVRHPLRFHDVVKGLLLYGYKVVRPTHLGCLTADFTLESTG